MDHAVWKGCNRVSTPMICFRNQFRAVMHEFSQRPFQHLRDEPAIQCQGVMVQRNEKKRHDGTSSTGVA